MLCRYKINSPGGAPPLPGSMISCETLASYTQASSVVDQAKAEARQLLKAAHAQREELLEKANLQVWQRANAQLKRWEIERQALCDNLERYATAIANQAIHLLLEDTPAPQRMAALIKQLLASHVPAVKAALVCHPLELEAVRACLANRGSTHWTLRADNTIKPQSLILNTEEGDFRIDWTSLVNLFLKPDDSHSNDGL
jgi:type III secretion protein L